MNYSDLRRRTMLIESDIASKAKAFFGVTHNAREAGYILPDGTMLDLSGRHEANGYIRSEAGTNVVKRGHDWLADQRSTDHREIIQLYKLQNGTKAMIAFMVEAGALRFKPDTGFETCVLPQPRQLARACAAHWSISSEPLIVDVSDEYGSVIANKEFTRREIKNILPFIRDALAGSTE